MGVTPGVLYAQDATGWTTFTASGTPQNGFNTGAPASGNTMVIFVSSSTGKDPGDAGFVAATQGSSATPYRTVTTGISKMRSGEADWCLMKKGDTFVDVFELKNNNTGKSATEPQVYSCYDPGLGNPMVVDPSTGGARPIFNRNASNEFIVTGGNAGSYLGGNFVAFVGLDIYDNVRNPDDAAYDPTKVNTATTGISIGSNTTNQWMLVEDVSIRWCNLGFGPSPQMFYTWRFTVSSSSTVSAGDIYSNNGALFYVTGTDGGLPGVLFTERQRSSGSPTASGTLTKVSGNAGSSASITFTAAVNPGFNSGTKLRRSQLLNNASIFTSGGDGAHTNQTAMVLEENCIDHNGWLYGSTISFIVSGFTITPTAGAVYSINDGLSTKTYTVASTGAAFMTCTKNQTTALNVRSGTLTKTSGTGDASISFTAITDTVGGNYNFNHNLYHSQFADEYDNSSYLAGVAHTGNIHSRAAEDEQQRRGGTISNGLFLYCPIVQNGSLSNDYIIDSCVVLESNSTAGFNQAQGITSAAAAHYDRGNATVTNNIIAHGKLGTMGPAIEVKNSQNGLIDNNIVFDWPGGNTTNTVNGGIISYGSITSAGSGASAVTFTGFVDDGSTSPTPSGIPGNILTVTSITGTPLKVNQRITGTGLLADTYIIGLGTGAGGTGTYQLFMDQRNTSPANAIVVASTTMSIDAYYVNMTTQTGSGSGATAYITLSGGGVGTITFFPANAFIGWAPGSGYAVGDQLSTSGIPGLTGFTVLVGSVRNTTVTGTNKFDAAGANTLGFFDPGRTIERYDAEVLGGPGTFAHFISLASANNKANWDPRLTADVINDWFVAGFALPGASVPEPQRGNRGHIHWPGDPMMVH